MTAWVRALLAAALCAAAGSAGAQDYPAKPVRVVVPFPPGGNTDVIARLLMPKLGERLGAKFVIENRSGGSGALGAEIVAKSPADGYTLGILTGTHAMGTSLHRKLAYDAKRDFAPVSQLASGAGVLVVFSTLRPKSVQELVAAAKARPNKLHYASAGNGTPPHLTAELFKMLTGVKLAHVPYKGMNAALANVAAGDTVVLSFPALSSALPLIRAKRVRAIAVTSAHRSAVLPDLPTIAESGVRGFDASMWYGLVARGGTSDDIVTRLHGEIAQIVYAPDVREKLAEHALEPVAGTSAEFAALIRAEIAKWSRVVAAAGIEVE